MLSNVGLEMRPNGGKIEAEAAQVWVSEADLHAQAALSRANIGERLAVAPRELLGDGDGRSHTDAGHSLEQAGKPVCIGVKAGEEIATLLDLVLRPAGFAPVRQTRA